MPGERDDLLLMVDFKWLMSGQGCWIDPQRWLADPQYTRHCVQHGCDSPHAPLQRCAQLLLSRGLVQDAGRTPYTQASPEKLTNDSTVEARMMRATRPVSAP